METVMSIVNLDPLARSNPKLLSAFISLNIKLGELINWNEFSGFKTFQVTANKSRMMHMELGTPIQIDCILTPEGFDPETSYGRIIIRGLLYTSGKKTLSTHWGKTPIIEGLTKEVVSELARTIVHGLRHYGN